MRELTTPTVTASGRRTPGLKVHDLRLLAVMQALVNFAYLAGTGTFRTQDLLPRVQEALGHTPASYTLSRLRYDLTKLRGKGLVLKITGTRCYSLTPGGYCTCVLYLKLFHKIYGPLTSGLLDPVPADANLPHERQTLLDRLYLAVEQALTKLLDHVGIKSTA